MKITLLHPSRGRAEKAKRTYDLWMMLESGKHQVEHILSVDFSDSETELNKYQELFGKTSKIVFGHNDGLVEATNTAAEISTGEILIYLSDDFVCPHNWDESLVQIFNRNQFGYPCLVKVDDCLQPFTVPVLTIPIMNRALYKKLGYFWHPGYKSMFVDEDLYWTCKTNNWMVMALELKFAHEHPANGKAENDDTYRRSAANWDQGKAFYGERLEKGFPV